MSWLVILSLPLLRLGALFYEDVGREGVYVVHVHEVSARNGYLSRTLMIIVGIAITAERAFTGKRTDRPTG